MHCTVLEAGWAPGPVWTDMKNLAPHRNSITEPSNRYTDPLWFFLPVPVAALSKA